MSPRSDLTVKNKAELKRCMEIRKEWNSNYISGYGSTGSDIFESLLAFVNRRKSLSKDDVRMYLWWFYEGHNLQQEKSKAVSELYFLRKWYPEEIEPQQLYYTLYKYANEITDISNKESSDGNGSA